MNMLLQRDNNGIYIWGDSAAKMETEVNQASVEHAQKHFTNIYNQYIKAGSFFKIPLGESKLVVDEVNGITSNLSAAPIEYDYYYF